MITFENNQHYQHILELLEDGFVRADMNGVITMANRKVAEMFGYLSPNEMIGLSMVDLYAYPHDRKIVLDLLKTEGKLINYELELRKKNNETFWSISNIKFIHDESGKNIGTEGVIRDITPRIEAERKLKAVTHDMGERMKELNLLYQATQAITTGGKLSQIIESVVVAIPNAWQYPDITTAVIVYNGKNYFSKNFNKSQWQQSADIRVKGKKKGQIEVYYTKEMKELDEGPFMKEERDLINTLAHYLGLAAEDIEVRHELDLSYQQLQVHEQQLNALNQQLRANNQQLTAGEQQLRSYNQQLNATEQQLRTANQQLIASEQQLKSTNQQLRTWNQQLEANEKYLKISEIRYQRAEAIGHIGNWEYNLKTEHFWGSKEAKRIYGFNINTPEFTVEHVESCIPERDRVHQALIDLIEKGKPYDLEFEILTKDKGERKYIHSIAELLKDKKGNPKAVVGVLIDITQQKRVEENLKESQTQFKNIVENSTNLFYAHDTEHKLSFVSPQVQNYLACEPEEAMVRWTEFVTDNPINEKGFQYTLKAIETGERQPTYELELQRKDGKKILVEVREAPVIENGKVTGIVGSLVDITERKKAEKDIEESRILLKTIINATPDLVWLKDVNGVYLNCNKRFEDFFGKKEEEILGKTDYDFLSKELADFFTHRDKLAMKAGKPIKNEEEITFASDGHSEVLETIKTPVTGNNNEIMGVLGVGRDITQRKTFEKELTKAKEKAEESDKLKSAFLANMSHEIRTPMNGIMGFSSLLQKPGLSDEIRSKYVNIIRKSGERMLDTINDLIEISKIETGQEELHFKLVKPDTLLQNLYEFFKHSAEDKGLELIFERDPALENALIGTDIGKFNSIVTNLVRNAIKYTTAGFVKIREKKETNRLIVEVSDSGQGIPQDRHKAIFERFVQADIKDSQALEGAGLGLSIIKAYVEMMDGDISLESEPGKGSCFTIYIPVDWPKETPKKDYDTSESIGEVKLGKILIAEDDDISYQHLAIILEPYAEQILRAKDGEEIVKMAKSNMDCDLILMDIKMPLMNGIAATKQIRKFNKTVQIISQTAYAMHEDKELSIEAGCNGYISKPIDIDHLLKLIKQIK